MHAGQAFHPFFPYFPCHFIINQNTQIKLPTPTQHRRGGASDDGHTHTSQAKPREDAGPTGSALNCVGNGDFFCHLGDWRIARRRTVAGLRRQQQHQQQYQ